MSTALNSSFTRVNAPSKNQDETMTTPPESQEMNEKQRNQPDDAVTPSKQARTPKKPRTPKTPKKTGNAVDPTTPSAKSTATQTKKAASLPIPKSKAEATKADLLLWSMKTERKSAAEIDQMWFEQTGVMPSKGSLGARFARMKNNFEGLDDGDDVNLLWAAGEYEKSKFSIIADLMAKHRGTKSYPVTLITKEYKRIMEEKASGIFVPTVNASNDVDSVESDKDDEGMYDSAIRMEEE